MPRRENVEISASPEITTEKPDCPVCLRGDFSLALGRVKDRIWGKPGVFQLQRCNHCRLVMTRPRPDSESLKFYYQGSYTRRRSKVRFQTDTRIGRRIPRYRIKVLQKVHKLNDGDRLLDVGCSTGDFLRVARLASGCQVSGVELDSESIQRALDPEHTRYRVGTIQDVDFAEEGFTVITFFQSLEHHQEPVQALRRAHELLVPGGLCVVEVPNYGGFWRRVFRSFWMPLMVPQHLFHFERKTIRKVFETAGFRRILHHQTMFYPFEGVASFALWLWRVFHLPRRQQRDSWGWLAVPLVLLLLVVLFFVVEIPTQALLRLLGVSGHQITIAARD